MRRILHRLWNEAEGFVLSSEMILYGTLGVIGVTAGYTALRDAVNTELDDVAKAIGALNQSYAYSPVIGHGAYTAGSMYVDRAEYCDMPNTPPVAQVVPPAPPVDRPLVCADVFGPERRHGYLSPPSAPRSEPPHREPHSLRGPDGVSPQVVPQQAPAPQPAPHGHAPHGRPMPSKGVHVDPLPTMVAGAPGLAPVPFAPCENPVRVMVDPRMMGPYMIDVPEGYFNHGPGVWGFVPPQYQVHVHGVHDYGYAYAPAVPAASPPKEAGWDTLDLGFARIGDDELKHIDKFRTAKCLHVLGSNVTDRGLGYIAEMDQLESLHLVGTQITNAGLKQLKSLKRLRFLHLVGTRITDAGLPALVELKSLEQLDLRGTPVSAEGLARLAEKMPTLRVIR